ncbi:MULTISPECIES: DUF6087 family protein [unclassified Streptomyces]|uniref:DUF6087 family protein n=1 Tax=unclassified Streptomyces TaxID=2593676 RepID=UPI002E27E9E5|nr:DUF6087 family protein [Streptomyces sp. NBC_01439]
MAGVFRPSHGPDRRPVQAGEPACRGGASHLRPNEPRVLEERNGFAYAPAGTTPNLATTQERVNEIPIDNSPAAQPPLVTGRGRDRQPRPRRASGDVSWLQAPCLQWSKGPAALTVWCQSRRFPTPEARRDVGVLNLL